MPKPLQLSACRTELSADSVPSDLRSPYLAPGLLLLLQANRCARECRQDPWEFAAELGELHAAGLSHGHLRWLVCQGYVEHARERTVSGEAKRSFVKPANISFSRRSCFVLTSRGHSLASQLGEVSETVRLAQAPPPAQEGITVVPRWDPRRRELWWRSSLVKKFRVPASNQQALLDALEEEGWPARIDDPLAPMTNGQVKARLHDTIKALNRHQVCRLLRFFGDGTGQAVMWEALDEDR